MSLIFSFPITLTPTYGNIKHSLCVYLLTINAKHIYYELDKTKAPQLQHSCFCGFVFCCIGTTAFFFSHCSACNINSINWQLSIEEYLTSINHVQTGLLFASLTVLAYLYFRKYKYRKKISVSKVIMAFAFGFTLSFCLKIITMGAYGICSNLDDMGNGCLSLGGFSLAAITIAGLIDSITRD